MFFVLGSSRTTCDWMGYTISTCLRAILSAHQVSMHCCHQKADKLLRSQPRNFLQNQLKHVQNEHIFTANTLNKYLRHSIYQRKMEY